MSDEKHIDMQADHGEDHASTREVMNRERTMDLSVPLAEVSTLESIVTGFRQRMFDLTDADGNEVGSIDTGAGLGSDFITLNWGDRTAIVRGIDLLRAWVATFDPEAAKQLPGGGLR